NRWWQLSACMLAMVAIANLQYSWTLFTVPLSAGLNAKLSEIQLAFTLFIMTQSWLVPIEGFLVDRLGARIVIAAGGLLVGLSWIGAGLAQSVHALCAWYVLGGIGVGSVYGACVGTILKWFPDRRGLAAGLVVGAYGTGAVMMVLPIQRMIEHSGYRATFVTWGIVQGIVVMILARFMVGPPSSWRPGGTEPVDVTRGEKEHQSLVSYTPIQMLKTGTFYLMYLSSVLITFGGLVVTAQLKPIASAYGLDKGEMILGVNALALALMVNLISTGATRPFWGWLSDHIGRYNTMALAFGLGSLSVLGLIGLIHSPMWFIVLSAVTVFSWGATFVLFAAATGDVFGVQYAATNNGIVYTSKGMASIFSGWGAARLVEMTGSWLPVLWTAFACNLLAAILAFSFLKPLVARITIRQA
ncbi:MAG TPA: oxalate/formate MFS antiporter, partial [Candidatus Methylomirabilis sp.]|nr:oxalate/formate MFS antiporter [Candidatus Methylomirabilis sp.]